MIGGFSRRGDARITSIPGSARAFRAASGFAPGFASALNAALARARRPLAMLAAVSALAALSACSLFPQQGAAPIVDHSNAEAPPDLIAAEPDEASAPAVAEPASGAKPRPAKPKKRVVKPKPRETAVQPPPEEPPPPPPPEIITTRIMQPEQVHGLLDSEVQRPDGKVIGRAVDAFADPAGKPKLMVLNLSGFLGVGDRKVTFPWSAFRFNPAAKKAPITLVPTPPANPKAKPEPPKPGSVNDIPPSMAQLVDSTVLQRSGARMGRVVDVLIDAQARPQALVVDLSNSLSGEKRHVAANWADVHIVTRNKAQQLQIDFNDAQLKASPTYAPEQPIKIVSPVVPPPVPASAPAAASGASASGVPAAVQPASATPAAAPVTAASGATASAGAHAPKPPTDNAK